MDNRIEAAVQTGLGRAPGFTGLPWVGAAVRRHFGIELHPGTLNLGLQTPMARSAWRSLRSAAGVTLEPGDADTCAARCHPVRVSVPDGNPVTAVAIVPEVRDYPDTQVELIAALNLRDTLRVADAHVVQFSAAHRPQLSAALFDVDGTLVDSLGAYVEAASRALAPWGWTVPADAVRRTLNFGESFWALVLPAAVRNDAAFVERLRTETMRQWSSVLSERVGLIAGVAPALHELRRAGLKLGICTSSLGESFAPLREAGLLKLFDVIVTARDVVRRKPDPEGLRQCLGRLDLPPERVVYVGDSVVDMRASRAAGVFSLGLLTGAGDSALLSAAGADRLLPDWTGVAEYLLA